MKIQYIFNYIHTVMANEKNEEKVLILDQLSNNKNICKIHIPFLNVLLRIALNVSLLLQDTNTLFPLQ